MGETTCGARVRDRRHLQPVARDALRVLSLIRRLVAVQKSGMRPEAQSQESGVEVPEWGIGS
jgi:hypothetical protein